MEPAQTLIDCEEEEEEAKGKVVDDKMLSTLVCAICQSVFHTPVSLVMNYSSLFRFFSSCLPLRFLVCIRFAEAASTPGRNALMTVPPAALP
jgi:hypothetical protein